MVDLALSSMALAVYSKAHRNHMAAKEASSRYHCLLQIVQEHIVQVETSNLSEEDTDAYLMAIYLMSRYENTTTRLSDFSVRNSFQSLATWSHHNGAMAVLKVWYDKPSRGTATVIIKYTRRGLIRSCLLRKLLIPDWMLDGEDFGEIDWELEHDRIIVSLVNLRRTLAGLEQRESLFCMETRPLLQHLDQLDKALQAWMTKCANQYTYQQHILSDPGPLPQQHLYSCRMFTYSRIGDAATWGTYFAERMLIDDTKLKVLATAHIKSSKQTQYGKQRLASGANIDHMASNLASTLPFCLERITHIKPGPLSKQSSITLRLEVDVKPYAASLMVWPLSIASSLGTMQDHPWIWFKAELAELGRILGDGVLQDAQTNQWTRL